MSSSHHHLFEAHRRSAAKTIRDLEEEYQKLLIDQRAEAALSSGSSECSYSAPPTPRDRMQKQMHVDVHPSSRYPSHYPQGRPDVDRLPSVRDILSDNSPLDSLGLQLPPLRMK